MCVIMLSSVKSSVVLLLVLIATPLSLSAAMKLRHIHETTTIATEAEAEPLLSTTTLLSSTTPKPANAAKTTTTKKWVQSSPSSQQIVEDYGKSVKIFFPTNNNSEENSKFDVYGLKTTPPPPPPVSENKVKIEDKMATTEATKSNADGSNSVSNSTVKSIDDRLGVLNLAPHCPAGQVIVNQHCHKSA